jgi:nucleoid-associated protein YgaU
MARPAARRAARAGTWTAALTRRGWAALAILVVLVSVGAYLVGGANSGQVAYVPSQAVTVHQGDTLWSIAEQHTPPGEDVRATLALIHDLNGLTGSVVHAGDTLWVPPVEP